MTFDEAAAADGGADGDLCGEGPGPGSADDDDLDQDHIFVGDLEDADVEDDGAGELGTRAGGNRAPICGFCGVTALPADPSNVIDTAFVCDNEDCDAYRDLT